MPENQLNLLEDLIAKAKAAGADAADAVMIDSVALSYAQRLGKLERLERQEGQDLGLRVFQGKRQAVVSSTDFGPATLDELVGRVMAMVRSVPEDPYCGIAEPEELASDIPLLELCDPDEPSTDLLIERARACEEAARSVPGVTNSEGAEAEWSTGGISLATSNGFAGAYRRSGHSVSVSVLAGQGLEMERDYEYSSTVYGEDLEDPASIGRSAGERTVRRLGAKKPATAELPVIFDPRVAGGLIGHMAGAITGPSIARGTSFLKDKLDEAVFAETITIVDDPHRPRGLRSKPFDAEGIANQSRKIIDRGRLTTWVMDLASARQLGMKTTGHASRSTSSPPAPSITNLYMEAGALSPEELIADIGEGFYVTEMMGMGVNGVTGDYSRGAAGFWIENGEITYPVSEATVAGNLIDMYLHLTPASDLVFRYGTNAPTLRIENMTVAGS